MLCNGLVHIQFFAVLPLVLIAEHYPTWAYASLTAVSATLGVGLQLNVTKRTQSWPIWAGGDERVGAASVDRPRLVRAAPAASPCCSSPCSSAVQAS